MSHTLEKRTTVAEDCVFLNAFTDALADDVWEYEKHVAHEDDRSPIDCIGWSAEALADAERRAQEFLDHNAIAVRAMGIGFARAGELLHLTTAGHGVGFWEYGSASNPIVAAAARRLDAAAKSFGSVDGYVGDDGYLVVP